MTIFVSMDYTCFRPDFYATQKGLFCPYALLRFKRELNKTISWP